MSRKKSSKSNKTANRRRTSQSSSSLGKTLRRPGVQIGVLAVVVVLIFLIASIGSEKSSNGSGLPAFVSVDEAHQMYEEGTFVLDVRTPEEWNKFHAPNTT